MRSKLRFIFLFLLITANVYAGNGRGFRLDIESSRHKMNKGYLLTYRSGETYLLDSCEIDNRGKASIFFDKMLPAGEYLFRIKPDTEIPLLIDSGQDNIKLRIGKKAGKNKISGSSDTQILWQYLDVLDNYNKEQSELLDKYRSSADKGKLKTLLDKSDKAFRTKEQEFIDNNEGTWASTYLRGMQHIPLPYDPPQSDVERRANSDFMKHHYFDNINMDDVRLLRTNYLYSYIDNYQNNWVEQNPDSLAESAVRIVGLAEKNPVFMQQLLAYLINNSLSSTYMGMENVWARLAEEYIFDNEKAEADTIQMMILTSRYETIRYNRVGMKARDLQLKTIDGNNISLYNIEADNIILCFYNPECSHCRVEIEFLQKNIYPRYKDKGLKIVAVNIFPQKDQWRKFVDYFGMNEWINCADPEYKSSYWLYYNTSSIPALYVLDLYKKIIAKDLNEQSLEQLFKRIYKD